MKRKIKKEQIFKKKNNKASIGFFMRLLKRSLISQVDTLEKILRINEKLKKFLMKISEGILEDIF